VYKTEPTTRLATAPLDDKGGSVPKTIAVTVLERGARAVAELQETDAPKTCEALWQALAQPIEATGIHAMWAGREIMVDVPPPNRVFDPAAVPLENATVYPAAGDICWGFFPPYTERGFGEGVWDIAIVYGRETRFYVPLGMHPLNIWACIVDGLPAFAEACAGVRTEGLKTFRLERVSG
jgi:hypothetical protein